jgi:hypothetical protein
MRFKRRANHPCQHTDTYRANSERWTYRLCKRRVHCPWGNRAMQWLSLLVSTQDYSASTSEKDGEFESLPSHDKPTLLVVEGQGPHRPGDVSHLNSISARNLPIKFSIPTLRSLLHLTFFADILLLAFCISSEYLGGDPTMSQTNHVTWYMMLRFR